MHNYKIILASNSPRRKELLSGLDLQFEVKVIPGIDESYPDTLSPFATAEYIAAKKAEAYKALFSEEAEQPLLVITADTVVIARTGQDETVILGKPKDAAEAHRMLTLLSGATHHVVTGVCLTTSKEQRRFSVTTKVTFRSLKDEEIDYYISHYRPFDKAGAYGIQEWIGYVGCTGLEGSYFNVMGLPVQRIYEEMEKLK